MKIPILMYHQIDVAPPSGTPLRGLVVSPQSFALQMALLKTLGYKGLSMRQLEPYLQGERSGKVVGITFDDGYRNNLTNALPVLARHGFTATCYAVSNQLGGTNLWDHGKVAQTPLMSIADWKLWFASGMDVGSHTKDHVDLTQTDAHQALEQIAGSRTDLERALGVEVRHFCYPYGRFSPEHAEMVKAAGYHSATTTRRGRVQTGDDPLQLRRVLVARATNPLVFSLKVISQYEDRRG